MIKILYIFTIVMLCENGIIALSKIREVTKMKVSFIVNNYVLGGKVKSTPTDKIIEQHRIDKTHTYICYDINDREKQFIEKVLSYKGKIEF